MPRVPRQNVLPNAAPNAAPNVLPTAPASALPTAPPPALPSRDRKGAVPAKAPVPHFILNENFDDRRLPAIRRRLPPLSGQPIRLGRAPGLRDRHGPVHAGAFLRERRILFDCARAEFPRIFVHELFHFVWLRLGNPARISFEQLIAAEIAARARGELGWAAESRKCKLSASDPARRTRRWRDYCCESFCDTAAWLYSGLARHPEFTLRTSWRKKRADWFRRTLAGRELPI